MFIGREYEIQEISSLIERKKASLIICKGRRRIGKSTLIHEIAKRNDVLIYDFEGLAPSSSQTSRHQLAHFSKELFRHTSLPKISISSWLDAFRLLTSKIDKKTIIFLDEISWMAAGDPQFPGYLKIAWDTIIKKNENITLIICGSVASWIDNNILKNTAFVGRITATFDVKELPLNDCSRFWKNKHISSFDKFKVIAVTGGVPRYLEEINYKLTAEKNIYDMCFKPHSFLLHEFDDIFSDSFALENIKYRKIIFSLLTAPKSFTEVCKDLRVDKNGAISEMLENLQLAGFLSRDYVYKPDGKISKKSQFRISDNYVRFYVKYILPQRDKILKNVFKFSTLENLPQWSSIMGLQFQNTMLANLHLIILKLDIDASTIITAGPYFQTKNSKIKESCQIDLLIQVKHNSFYLCEFKFKKSIGTEVIDEIEKKAKALSRPKNTSIHPVLIYAGVLSEEVIDADYFSKIINAESFLE